MKRKFYTVENILKCQADYNMIIGERSNGKTYACLKYALQQYIEHGYEFVYLRRWKEDIIGKRADSIFNALIANDEIRRMTKNRYDTIVFYRGRFFIGKRNVETNKIESDKNPIGYAMSLTEMEHDKSTSYPNVRTIIFDEFITRLSYLPNEFVIFMNVLSTIIRTKNNVKIFMLGNTVNQYCVYFDEMGITKISQQKQGTIDLYTYGNSKLLVAVEYCGNIASKKSSDKYFAFDNSRLEMIKNGAWELAIYPHLSENESIKDTDITFRFTIEYKGKMIDGDIIENENGYFLFFHKRTKPLKDNQLCYTLDYTTSNFTRKCFAYKMDNIDAQICKMFACKKVFYQSNEIGELVNNYLKDCVKNGVI